MSGSWESTARRVILAEKWVFLGSLGLVISILWWGRLRHWFPHDEGTLGQAALRVLAGEVPHRDFVHPYTGADALFHAGIVSLFGPSLASLRTGFAVVVTVWVIAMAAWFWSRIDGMAASLAVLLLGAWGIGLYFAAMPSWYVTILVTCAVALVLPPGSAAPSGRRLLFAGICLGLACTFKVTALFAVAGLGCWLIADGSNEPKGARPWAVAFLLVVSVGLIMIFAPALTPRYALHVALPPAAVVAWALAHEYRRWRKTNWCLDSSGFLQLLPGICGLMIGASPVLLWLAANGALGDLLGSLAGVSGLRGKFAAMPPPSPKTILLAVPVVFGIWATRLLPVTAVLAVFVAMVLGLGWDATGWYNLIWQTLRGALPAGVVAVLLFDLARRHTVPPQCSLVIAVLAWLAASQYPFAAPIYFVYLIPVALCLVAVAPSWPVGARRIAAAAGIVLVSLGYTEQLVSAPAAHGWRLDPSPVLAILPGEHGGLLVPVGDSVIYGRIGEFLSDSVVAGAIWSGPDAPEIAVIAGRKDLNRSAFSFLGSSMGGITSVGGAVAVVINRKPAFSSELPADSVVAWTGRYARSAEIGGFSVHWERLECETC